MRAFLGLQPTGAPTNKLTKLPRDANPRDVELGRLTRGRPAWKELNLFPSPSPSPSRSFSPSPPSSPYVTAGERRRQRQRQDPVWQLLSHTRDVTNILRSAQEKHQQLKEKYWELRSEHVIAADLAKPFEKVARESRFTPGRIVNAWCPQIVGISAQNERRSTVSEWAGELYVALKTRGKPDQIHVLSLAESPSLNDVKGLYVLRTLTPTLLFGKINDLVEVPVVICQHLISNIWDFDLRHQLAAPDESAHSDPTQPHPLWPPSMRKSFDKGKKAAPLKPFWGMYAGHTGNMDPRRGDNEIYLTWMSQVDHYHSDLRAYIQELHKPVPLEEYCKIALIPSKNGANKILLSFRSCRTQFTFARKHQQSISENEISRTTRSTTTATRTQPPRRSLSRLRNGSPIAGSSSAPFGHRRSSRQPRSRRGSYSEPPSPGPSILPLPRRSIILSPILCAMEVLMEDTSNFLVACSQEIDSLSMKSRHSPSVSKMRFFTHLEECHKVSMDGLSHGLQVLDRIAMWDMRDSLATTSSRDDEIQLWYRIDNLRDDLKHLRKELKKMKGRFAEEQETLTYNLRLTQDVNLWRLTLLASIFLPLTFTTSIFGMNMTSQTPEGPKGLSSFAKEAVQDLTEPLRNSTEAIVSTIGASGARTFAWRTFLITLMCLLLTLPLFMSVGRLIRWITAGPTPAVKYARSLVPIVVLGLFALSVSNRIGTGVSSGLLLLYEVPQLWLTFQAWPRDDSHERRWLLLVVTTLVFMSASLGANLGSLMLVPWGGLWYGLWSGLLRQTDIMQLLDS